MRTHKPKNTRHTTQRKNQDNNPMHDMRKNTQRNRKMNKLFIVYLAFIVFTEYVTIIVNQSYGLFHYAFILVAILTLFSINPEKNPLLYLSLSLAPIIRIISLSTQGQIISDISLILLLASKELISTDTRKTLQAIYKALTTVIAPLLISFTLNISNILGLL